MDKFRKPTSKAILAEEQILVIINPAAKAVSFESDLTVKEILNQFGGGITFKDGRITAGPQTAVFVRVWFRVRMGRIEKFE